MPSSRRMLEPAVVASLVSMELRARSVVEGFLLGLHRSPASGFSVEFSEYRRYVPGDDLSRLDWKAYARTGRYYVKRFEEDTNLECRILLDVSASMGYTSQAVSKLDYGRFLAAALAYLMHRQHDAAGLVMFDDHVVAEVPVSARPRHLHRILAALERVAVGGRSDVARPLQRLASEHMRRGLVIVISDLLDEPEHVITALRHLRFKGGDLVVFRLLDPAEVAFPFASPVRFRDLETGAEVTTDGATARASYLQATREVGDRYARELRRAGVDLCVIETTTPLDTALRAYLDARSKLM